jgi:soluble lytic murein transglycosylase
MRSLPPLLTLLFGLLGPVAAYSGTPAAPTQVDQAYLDAREAFRVGERKKLDRAALLLRDHALFPYVESYQLHLQLDELAPEVVLSFLARHSDSLAAERLYTEWVRSLGKRQRWELFGEHYAALNQEDQELSCYGLQYRARSDPEALFEARGLWFTGQDLPEACAPLFEQLAAQGKLGTGELRARQRLAVEAGNAALVQKLNTRLPPAERVATKRLEFALHRPERLLAKGDLKWQQPAERELALLALWRLARNSPTAAHEFWTRHRERLAPADALATLGQIAHQGARRLQPEALEWYRAAEGVQLSEAALAWKARIALRFANWPMVLSALQAMPLTMAQEPVWRYWKGRALRQLGRYEEARTLWEPLAREFSYYGLLAAEELGVALEPKSEPTPATPEALARVAAMPAVQRMLKFYELGLRFEGTREWIWAIRGMSDEELLVAAEFARRQGILDRAINTADKTVARHDFNLRFMTPYREHLSAAAREHGLDEALVFALVRQESRFLPEARSRAGAVGLMQLMPPTAKWVAGRTGSRDYRPSQIGIVDVNVKFGAYYLRYVLDRLGGLPVLATAAYNAGPTRALNWRGPIALEGAIYVESIPFTETRDYVKKVLANAMFYAPRLGTRQVPLKTRLGVIPSRDASLNGVYPELIDTSAEAEQ